MFFVGIVRSRTFSNTAGCANVTGSVGVDIGIGNVPEVVRHALQMVETALYILRKKLLN